MKPEVKSLFITWLILMGLGLGTMIAGRVTGESHLGLLWLGGLLLVTFVKTRLILYDYLELKTAYGGWGKLFLGLGGLILFCIYLIYAFGVLVLHI